VNKIFTHNSGPLIAFAAALLVAAALPPAV
jgi:hypothetical protein